MAVAFFAMMSMVIVPVSCGNDDDDEKDDKGSSSDGLAGKMFQGSFSKGDIDASHIDGIIFFKFISNGRFETYKTYCDYNAENPKLREFSELKLDDEGAYYEEGSKLTLIVDGYNPEKTTITKIGEKYEFVYDDDKFVEVDLSEAEMNKKAEEFKKTHTH